MLRMIVTIVDSERFGGVGTVTGAGAATGSMRARSRSVTRLAMAGPCDFRLEDQFNALQRRECDPAAVLEQLIPRRVGALGHLAERPGNLGDVLTVERRTEAEWRCCHNDGAVLC